MRIESRPDKGTTVKVKIPVLDTRPDGAEGEREESAGSRS